MPELKKAKLVVWISVSSILLCVLVPAFFYTISAAQSSRVSDEQLIARAINGEARGEPYEG